MSTELEKFKAITDIVIEKMEGGYYHPNMKAANPKKFKSYGNSGETMFGIDRVAGDAINKTAIGKKFWKLIDQADAKNNWSWMFMGGSLRSELTDLVVKIIYPEFKYLSKLYLSKKAQEIIFTDDRLLFNFIYATWNGSGWFQKFATDFSDKIADGERNLDKLVKYTLDLRTKEGLIKGLPANSLIKQGGLKIAKFIDTLKTNTSNITGNIINTPVIIAGIILTLYILKNKFNA
jgi:hypothetical protein